MQRLRLVLLTLILFICSITSVTSFAQVSHSFCATDQACSWGALNTFSAGISLPALTNGCLTVSSGIVGSQTCSGGGLISSVFGRTGTVTAQSGDYSTYYLSLGGGTLASTLNGTVFAASTTISSPQFCIGASCITAWPASSAPAGTNSIQVSNSSGSTLLALPNASAGSWLASTTATTAPAMQTKTSIDIRDIGADCTFATDSSTALNSFFSSGISGLTITIPVPCHLRVNSTVTIQGQENFHIIGQGSIPSATNFGPLISGCLTSGTNVLYVNQSGLWTMEGFSIEAKGNSCSSTATTALQVDNSGGVGYTETDTLVNRMGFSSNWGGTKVTNFIGINDTALPNGESFRVRDSLIQCQNDTNSQGIVLHGANQDIGEIYHNSFSDCYQALVVEQSNPRIENNLFGSDGGFSVFGSGGAQIFLYGCVTASAPVSIIGNETSGGGQFINSNNDTSPGCEYLNVIGNTIAVSDIASTAYPINIGTNNGIYTLIGNVVNLQGASTSASAIGSSSQASCSYGPLGQLIDIGNTLLNSSNNWSGCAGGNDFQGGHIGIGGVYSNGVYSIPGQGGAAGLIYGRVLQSTVATGTAPFTVASTTVVPNLNVSELLGGTWAAPGTIGGGTPAAITGTTITANTGFSGNVAGNLTGVVLPHVLYSVGGTALPTCNSGIQGEQAVVSDAGSPTYMGTYTGSGSPPITTAVICSYNGTTYAWLTH